MSDPKIPTNRVTIIDLTSSGTIPLDYTLRVAWDNAKPEPGVVTPTCVGATVNPAYEDVSARSHGELSFSIVHSEPATGVTISVELAAGGSVASDAVDNITVEASA